MAIRLYLMRHALAVERGAPGFADDARRPLTDEGKQQARKVAKGLRRLEAAFDMLLTSPYLRATQTAEQVIAVFGENLPRQELTALRPQATPKDTSKVLVRFASRKRLLLIGHEPHLSAWLGEMIGGESGARCLMKKAGVACVEVDRLPPGPGQGTLRWLMTPKQLSWLAKSR